MPIPAAPPPDKGRRSAEAFDDLRDPLEEMQALLDFLVRHVVDDPLHIGLAAETARNIAATQALFAAFGAKDIPAILEYPTPAS
ncbi:MAG: hypothetical protein RH982_11295 [Parvibaculum sp.]|uniref:hypothetical protein n=1 Tax=Parvibaculum sp. TaxID=2024848 RepID=UPI0032EFA0EE